MKKQLIYWIHFFLFVLTGLNINSMDYVRVVILGVYIIIVFFLIFQNSKFKYLSLAFTIFIISYLLLNLLILKEINIHLLFIIFSGIVIINLNFYKENILSLINKTAIVYLILSIIMNYTPLHVLSAYEVRYDIEHKFIPGINRFIGLEGSPAGPDILFSIVLIVNLFINKGKSKYLYIILSLLIIIWTSSISPIISLLGATMIVPFVKYKTIKIIYINLIWFYQYIVILVYSFSDDLIRYTLNEFSTWRAQVWYRVFNNLVEQSSLKEWIIGRTELIEFLHLRETIANNPHNFSLFMLQFCGILVYIVLSITLIIKFKNINDKLIIFILSVLIIYSSTNTFILTIRGNPIYIYIFISCLFVISGRKKKLQ